MSSTAEPGAAEARNARDARAAGTRDAGLGELALNWIARAAFALAIVLGVTLLAFLLIVYAGPDASQWQAGRNPTAAELERLRAMLGYDQPFVLRYLDYLRELALLDFGHSWMSGREVSSMLARTVPISLAVTLPGFFLGHGLALGVAALAAWHRNGWLDQAINIVLVSTMSLSLLVVVIAAQLIFSSSFGLDAFPVRGWRADNVGAYLRHAAVPTLAMTFAAFTYNARFYRAIMLEELRHGYVRAARATGAGAVDIVVREVLPNLRAAIITRVLFSLPVLATSGSLLIENVFGIPGVGRVLYDAILSGDQPVLKALIGLAGVLFALTTLLADSLYRRADARVYPQ